MMSSMTLILRSSLETTWAAPDTVKAGRGFENKCGWMDQEHEGCEETGSSGWSMYGYILLQALIEERAVNSSWFSTEGALVSAPTVPPWTWRCSSQWIRRLDDKYDCYCRETPQAGHGPEGVAASGSGGWMISMTVTAERLHKLDTDVKV